MSGVNAITVVSSSDVMIIRYGGDRNTDSSYYHIMTESIRKSVHEVIFSHGSMRCSTRSTRWLRVSISAIVSNDLNLTTHPSRREYGGNSMSSSAPHSRGGFSYQADGTSSPSTSPNGGRGYERNTGNTVADKVPYHGAHHTSTWRSYGYQPSIA